MQGHERLWGCYKIVVCKRFKIVNLLVVNLLVMGNYVLLSCWPVWMMVNKHRTERGSAGSNSVSRVFVVYADVFNESR
jgi:hypothetical protein